MSSPAAKGLAQGLVHLDEADDKQKLVLVPLDYIQNLPRPDELRMDEAEFKELCASIKEEGLHEPIGVRTLTDGLFRLVYGRHRAAAHVELGLDVVPALIRDDLDDASEVVATALENLQRKDLRPYEEAEAYQACLDVDGMTQVQLAKRLGVGQGQISKRLKLLQVPRPIAMVGAESMTLEQLMWFAPVKDVPAWEEPIAKGLASSLARGFGSNTVSVVLETVCDGKKAWDPFRQLDDVRSISTAGYSARFWVRDNPTYRKDIYALEHVRFGPEKSPDMVVVLDPKKGKEAAERALQRWQATQDKKTSESSTSARSWETPAQKRQKRVKNKVRKLQLEGMVGNLSKKTDFGDELVRLAYKEFLSAVGQVASRKIEQQALADILAEYSPKQDPHDYQKPLSRGLPQLVDELWEKDRVVLDRYVAAVVHLHAGGYDHEVRDAQVLKFTTGKTPAALQKAAEAAVDGPKEAKPAKKKAAAKKDAKQVLAKMKETSAEAPAKKTTKKKGAKA